MVYTTRQNADLDWLLDDLVERVPAARRAMSALQAGTARGRRDGARAADASTDAAPSGAPASSPPEPVRAPQPPTATERDA